MQQLKTQLNDRLINLYIILKLYLTKKQCTTCFGLVFLPFHKGHQLPLTLIPLINILISLSTILSCQYRFRSPISKKKKPFFFKKAGQDIKMLYVVLELNSILSMI